MRQLFLTENGLHPTVGKSENIRQNTMSELNRRKFLLRAGTGFSAAWVTANWPALLTAATHAHNAAKAATPPKFEFFTPEEAAEVEAITVRLLRQRLSRLAIGGKRSGQDMMVDQPRYKTSDEVDFVIVGSGAAGGILAKELSTNGFRVVVLEQGPYLTEADFTHNEIEILALDKLTNHPKLQPTTVRKTPDEKAKPQRALVYGRCVGGTSVHFTANFWRFHEIDFIERSRVGPVPGAGLMDWPITYKDLEPYYTKVEWEIGVSGLAGASPFDPPRSKPYPMPPLPVKSSGVLFERAARKLGWHPFPAPMAILSQPRPGRSACVQCGFCLGFGCEVGAKSSSLVAAIRVAERTGRCEIRPNSYVHRIEADANSRATGAVYFDEKHNTHLQKAKSVVVCANGAETPRLLLLSANKQFPNGLANSSGIVGKYLMLNSGGVVTGQFENPLNDYKGFAVSRVLHDFYELDPQKVGFYGGGGLDARFDFTPISI